MRAKLEVVYFVETEDRSFIKIGMTNNIENRLESLENVLGPMEIRLIGCIPGGRDKERELHQEFLSSRVRGEWFRSSPELRGFIDKLEFLPEVKKSYMAKPTPMLVRYPERSSIPQNFTIARATASKRAKYVKLPEANIGKLNQRRILIQEQIKKLTIESDELGQLVTLMEFYETIQPGITVKAALELRATARRDKKA